MVSAPPLPVPPHSEVPVCIPARWGARRFPGKLLETGPHGIPILRQVWRIATRANLGPTWILAGDSTIAEAAISWGADCLEVFSPARNGSERIAEALRRGWVPHQGLVLNLQGDAVGATPPLLTAALDALHADPEASLGTVAIRTSPTAHAGRTCVRIQGSRAVEFSRDPLVDPRGDLLLHVGIYAYRVDRLLDLAQRPPGPLELERSLEQLRWLEQGEEVAVSVVEGAAALAEAIDLPGDLAAALTSTENRPPPQ